MIGIKLLSSLAILGLSAQFCLAGPVVDKAAEAERLAADGKAVEAILAMDSAVAKLWDTLPITFIEALFVTDRPSSYANFTPRENSEFKVGEDMLLYMELAGFGFGREGEKFNILLKADMEVRHVEGNVLGGRKDFLDLSHSSRVPNREFFAVITYNFTGIQPGEYIVTTTLKDQNSDRVASVDLPFKITQ